MSYKTKTAKKHKNSSSVTRLELTQTSSVYTILFVLELGIPTSTYLVDVLCRQQIKLFQVVFTSEFHE